MDTTQTQNRGMEPLEIRFAMLRKKVTGGTIAGPLGVTRNAVNKTVLGALKPRRIREAIADAIGKPYAEVWGEE